MITSLRELAFSQRDPHTLFGIREDLEGAIDTEFSAFGWAWVSHLQLEAPGSFLPLRDALVIAVHSLDLAEGESPSEAHDFELCFELDDQSVVCSLKDFLKAWLPQLPPAKEVVLAVCNPFRIPLLYAPQLSDGAVFYTPLGNVDCYAEATSQGPSYILVAEHWQVLHAS